MKDPNFHTTPLYAARQALKQTMQEAAHPQSLFFLLDQVGVRAGCHNAIDMGERAVPARAVHELLTRFAPFQRPEHAAKIRAALAYLAVMQKAAARTPGRKPRGERVQDIIARWEGLAAQVTAELISMDEFVADLKRVVQRHSGKRL